MRKQSENSHINLEHNTNKKKHRKSDATSSHPLKFPA
jgi:hypothetical protein